MKMIPWEFQKSGHYLLVIRQFSPSSAHIHQAVLIWMCNSGSKFRLCHESTSKVLWIALKHSINTAAKCLFACVFGQWSAIPALIVYKVFLFLIFCAYYAPYLLRCISVMHLHSAIFHFWRSDFNWMSEANFIFGPIFLNSLIQK